MGLFSSIGKVIGGAGKSSSKTEPWKASQPYLKDIMSSAGDMFDAGTLGGVRPFLGDTTRAGMRNMSSLARGNGVSGVAASSFADIMGAPRFDGGGGYASAIGDMAQGINYGGVRGPQATSYGSVAQPGTPQFRASQGPSSIGVGGVQGPSMFDVASRLPDGPASYGQVDPNSGIDAVRQNVMETTLPQIAGMFGAGGFSKSSMAQSAAGRAMASALAPYEYQQINRNQDVNRDQFNTEQDRGLNYGLASTGMEADQFNIDEGRRLGFDVNERDTRLNQANVNDARAVDFGASQNAADLAQQNRNADVSNAFNFALRDRQVDQSNLNDAERVAFDTQQHAAKLAQLNQNRDFRIAADDRLRDQYNTEQDRSFGQFFDQNQQQLAGLGLAPAISGLEFGNAQTLFDLGRFKDQNKTNRQEFDLNNLRSAADFFLPFGQLGTNASSKASPLDTIGKIGQGVTSLFGAF